MNENEIEQLELDLLIEAVFQRYGYDFRSYARASIERRVRHFAAGAGCAHLSELIPRALHDPGFFAELVEQLSTPVTEMFRDPNVFRALRREVLPLLRTYPFVRVWDAGCATGEEAYSLAILLLEEELAERATIFATDFNDAALDVARQGIYQVEKIQEYTASYREAGGRRSFAEYYHAAYGGAALSPALKQMITFANHNLASDRVFSEVHLVVCRNVLIYFDRTLQERALRLFTDSLVRGGFLCLGSKEDLQFTALAGAYETVDADARIYKKRVL